MPTRWRRWRGSVCGGWCSGPTRRSRFAPASGRPSRAARRCRAAARRVASPSACAAGTGPRADGEARQAALRDAVAAALAGPIEDGWSARLLSCYWPRDLEEMRALAADPRLGAAEVVEHELDWAALTAAVGDADLVVAMRYHAVAAAAMAGRPVIALAYEPKVRALAAELGLPTVDVDAPGLAGSLASRGRDGCRRSRDTARPDPAALGRAARSRPAGPAPGPRASSRLSEPSAESGGQPARAASLAAANRSRRAALRAGAAAASASTASMPAAIDGPSESTYVTASPNVSRRARVPDTTSGRARAMASQAPDSRVSSRSVRTTTTSARGQQVHVGGVVEEAGEGDVGRRGRRRAVGRPVRVSCQGRPVGGRDEGLDRLVQAPAADGHDAGRPHRRRRPRPPRPRPTARAAAADRARPASARRARPAAPRARAGSRRRPPTGGPARPGSARTSASADRAGRRCGHRWRTARRRTARKGSATRLRHEWRRDHDRRPRTQAEERPDRPDRRTTGRPAARSTPAGTRSGRSGRGRSRGGRRWSCCAGCSASRR